jgi:hypothetical protein
MRTPQVDPKEVLASRRWRSAFFTTYTLSLTFFETIVLRALRQQGCENVWVLVDGAGYRTSLMERRSPRIGQEYHLVPVTLPAGVFHPKVWYLAGDDGDVLCVGSGNLTFGGIGRNVEVMEVCASGESPQVFNDFADFLDALSGRAEIRIGDRTCLTTSARGARAAAQRSNGNDRRRLLHTVTEPISVQLPRYVKAPARSLSVLSPFHDPSGQVLRELSAALGCKTLRIGLPTNKSQRTTFPFPHARGWPVRVEAIRLDAAGAKRPLHAKWIEIEHGNERLILTGSVNATRAALATTNNIEVGILRTASKRDESSWESAEVPADFDRLVYEPPVLGATAIVYATLDADGKLTGQLFGSVEAAGTWNGVLRAANQRTAEFSAVVDADGRFACRPKNADAILFASSLQAEMTRDGDHARGWVHQLELLRVGSLKRLGVSALVRFLNGEETDDDEVALLDYFAMSVANHSALFAQRVPRSARGDAGGGVPDALPDIPIEQLAPTTDDDGDGHAKLSTATPGSAIDRLFAKLRVALLRGTPTRGRGVGSNSSPDGDGDDDGEDSSAALGDAFARFQRRMEAVLADERMTEAELRGVLVVWFEVSLHMYAGRLADIPGAVAFLWHWFRLATTHCGPSEEITALEEHVVAAATMLVALTSEHSEKVAADLHQQLERFMGARMNRDRLERAAQGGLAAGTSQLVLGDRRGDAFAVLARVLDSATPRQELLDVLSAHSARQVPRGDSPVFAPAVGQRFHRVLSAHPGVKFYATVEDAVSACPNCDMTFTPRAMLDLEASRIASCDVCGKWTVWVGV